MTVSDKATQLPALPALPAQLEPGLRQYLERLREIVQVRSLGRGEALDGHPTRRELVAAGLARWGHNGLARGEDGETGEGGGDRTIPPALTGLTAEGAFVGIYLRFDRPTYRNHAHAKVYRAPFRVFAEGEDPATAPGRAALFGDAQWIGVAPSTSYADLVDPGAKFYYWVTAVSTAGVEGPPNALAGTLGETAESLDTIREIVRGRLDETDLDEALVARIQDPTRAVQALIWAADMRAAVEALGSRVDELAAHTLRSLDSQLSRTLQQAGQIRANLHAIEATQQSASELRVELGSLSAVVQGVREVIVTQDQAYASQLAGLSARLGESEASLLTLEQVLAAADQVLVSRLDSLAARLGGAEGQITTLEQVQASAQSVTASRFTDLTANLSTTHARLLSLEAVEASTSQAMSQRVGLLESDYSGSKAKLSTLEQTVANEQGATASRFAGLQSQVDGHSGQITSLAQTEATHHGALSSRIDALSARTGDNEAGVSSVAAALTTETAARAAAVEQVTSQVGGLRATVETQASSIDGLRAQYTVKIDVNGHVAGYGLSVYPSEAGPTTSAFVVRTDSFAFAPPGYPAGTAFPFYAGTRDGKPFVYLDTAYIQDATIASAKIENLAADKIAAGRITAAIQLDAARIVGGEIFIGQRFSVDNAGNLTAANAILNNARLSGELVAATGTFSGTLTADAINAVDTLNVRGNAITAAAFGAGEPGATLAVEIRGVTAATPQTFIIHASFIIPTSSNGTGSICILYRWRLPNGQYETDGQGLPWLVADGGTFWDESAPNLLNAVTCYNPAFNGGTLEVKAVVRHSTSPYNLLAGTTHTVSYNDVNTGAPRSQSLSSQWAGALFNADLIGAGGSKGWARAVVSNGRR